MIRARVMEIERFAIKDGPGIRTVVFLQGCPLHCPWCSNPESQPSTPVLMHRERTCTGCGVCASSCPERCITWKPGEKPAIDRQYCTSCGNCTGKCPQRALRLSSTLMDCDSVIAVIARDMDYYRQSGGGVTFSGGEALAHKDAVTYMLKECKRLGIHTAVETCGNIAAGTVAEVLPLTDLFLFDLKHTDAGRVREVTGGDPDLILGNLRDICSANPGKVTLRMPCIPGFNMKQEHFRTAFDMAREFGIADIDLLPYHALGTGKYHEMGKEYRFSGGSIDRRWLEGPASEGRNKGLKINIL